MSKLPIFSLLLLFLPLLVSAECTCETGGEDRNKSTAFKYKIVAICSILAASAIGVSLPILGRKISALRPENNVFFLIKAFGAGVILATGFVHILSDAFETLTSPCLAENPWSNFPFTGFFAMLSAIATLMVDTFANSYYRRSHFNKARPMDEEMQGEHEGHVHVHTHATHGHAHGSAPGSDEAAPTELVRQRVISQVCSPHSEVYSHSLSLFTLLFELISLFSKTICLQLQKYFINSKTIIEL